MWRKPLEKLIKWEQEVVPKLSDSEGLSLISVEGGAERYAELRYIWILMTALAALPQPS